MHFPIYNNVFNFNEKFKAEIVTQVNKIMGDQVHLIEPASSP